MKPIEDSNELDRSANRTLSVPAVQRTLMILDFLAQSQRGATISQLARALQLPKSTSHALLLTLERSGYAQRDSCSGRYRLGMRLFRVANMALSGLGLRERAASYLRQLSELTQMAAHMAILEEGEVILIDKIVPFCASLPKVATWTGKRVGAHCTALGKALLAHVAESELDGIVRRQGMLRYNENTITSLSKLKEQCAYVRRLGYSTDEEEEEIGVSCIGAPVFDANHRIMAAISITGNAERLAETSRFGPVVRQAALAISGHLRSAGSEFEVTDSL